MKIPAKPKIYHITPIENLASILRDGGLLSDAACLQQQKPYVCIGIRDIKTARLRRPVQCNALDCVGDYVPFNFCPRSVMLYIIWRANHPNLEYRGGQEPILHLEADLRTVAAWAAANNGRWAFSIVNARAGYTTFFNTWNDLDKVDWAAVETHDFKPVKEKKQAEFLFHGFFPVGLIERIGVIDQQHKEQAEALLQRVGYKTPVAMMRNWYYP